MGREIESETETKRTVLEDMRKDGEVEGATRRKWIERQRQKETKTEKGKFWGT